MGLSLNLFPFVFIGGGIGATLRWPLSVLISQYFGRIWVGTFFVNLLGCILYFLIVKYSLFEGRPLSLGVKTGVLGSLTTFSTFSYEVVYLIKEQQFFEAVTVVFLNIFTGILIGIWILR